MAVAEKQEALVYSPPTPMQLLEKALANNLDIERMAQLMELQLRWEKNEARKAFVVAMNDFKKNPPTILKNKHVHFGQTDYNHATLDHVCDAVTKGLSDHGISHRWTVNQDAATIIVTCILTHELGHAEETTLQGPADTSGSKNPIQSIGSSVTYLQRYTLLAATGLAAANADTDGGGQTMGDLNDQLEYIENCRSLDELQRVFAKAWGEAKTLKDKRSMDALVAAKDKRKKELQ